MANEKRRLIDANAMREDWLKNGENEYVYDTNAVLDSIDAQPTVDAVEVVHGRWIGIGRNRYTIVSKCSNCCAKYDFMSNYCPNCGAKMDGGKDNE